jgi:hypothetical protein
VYLFAVIVCGPWCNMLYCTSDLRMLHGQHCWWHHTVGDLMQLPSDKLCNTASTMMFYAFACLPPCFGRLGVETDLKSGSKAVFSCCRDCQERQRPSRSVQSAASCLPETLHAVLAHGCGHGSGPAAARPAAAAGMLAQPQLLVTVWHSLSCWSHLNQYRGTTATLC